MNALRQLVRAYAAQFDLTHRHLVFDWLLGTAAIAVLALDAIALLIISGGFQ